MTTEDIYKVVEKLIGPINPVGETHIDEPRYENIIKFTELTEKLINKLTDIEYRTLDFKEYSISRVHEHTKIFLNKIKEELG